MQRLKWERGKCQLDKIWRSSSAARIVRMVLFVEKIALTDFSIAAHCNIHGDDLLVRLFRKFSFQCFRFCWCIFVDEPFTCSRNLSAVLLDEAILRLNLITMIPPSCNRN